MLRFDQRFHWMRLQTVCSWSLVPLLLLSTAACSRKSPPEQKNQPPPIPVLPRRNYDTARLFNGITLKSSVECDGSEQTAIAAASDTNSYQLDLTLHVHWPKLAVTREALLTATPALADLLPNLDQLVEDAVPSPDFTSLLAHKEKVLKLDLSSLQRLPYRDSLFDCQTILNLKNTSRSALLVQALMDVNTDGSDGDRNLKIAKFSSFFQPQTTYRWKKTTDRPNPCLREAEARLALLEVELGQGNAPLTPADEQRLKNEIDSAKDTVAELKRWSFLVGTSDPFIVLPSFMVGKEPGKPRIGDYAVVIAHGILYPAVVGDLGPNSKIGEASLRLCLAIDPKSEDERRPVSRPEIAYFVFPGSADKPFRQPDYGHWSERCHALWKEFGGSDTAQWHEWTSLETPWPTPTPEPTPATGTNPAATSPPVNQTIETNESKASGSTN